MSFGGAFLDVGNGQLSVLEPQSYEAEKVLQELLARYPELIAGPTTRETTPTQLLLISREAAIPSESEGSRTWSLDHLFVDTTAVPVFVEVKRSTDTRSRREVVAQMLDYAAHGVQYLPIDQLQRGLDGTAQESGHPDGASLLAAVGIDDPTSFWRDVTVNLGAGKIRMIFVADELSAELRRIIEFLKEQMKIAEVLGLELRKYTAGPNSVYVPTVLGRTETAISAKNQAAGFDWNEASFMEAALERLSADESSIVGRIFEHLHRHGGRVNNGHAQNPGVGGWYPQGGAQSPVWRLYIRNGAALFQFDIASIKGRHGQDRIDSMKDRLSAWPETSDALSRSLASLWLKDIKDDALREESFFATLETAVT